MDSHTSQVPFLNNKNQITIILLQAILPAFILLLFSACLEANRQQTASTVEPPRTADLSFDLEITNPAFPPGEGPVVIIDEVHNNFHTAAGTYQPFASLLEKDGYVIKPGTSMLSRAFLDSCQILVITDAMPPNNAGDPPTFSENEISALNEWVREGGRLFLITDHMPDPAAIDRLARSFGVEINNGYVMNRSPSGEDHPIVFSRGDTTLIDHPVTSGRTSGEFVESVVTFTGSAFRAGPDFQPVLVFGPGKESLMPDEYWRFTDNTPRVSVAGWYQGAVAEYGEGRIAVFSEAAMFTAQLFGEQKFPVGLIHPDAGGNARLLFNVMHWLSDLL